MWHEKLSGPPRVNSGGSKLCLEPLSLSDVLSVSQGHFSTWQHSEKSVREWACVRFYSFSKGWEESVRQAGPMGTSHPLVDTDLPLLPYRVSHSMSKHRQEASYGVSLTWPLNTQTQGISHNCLPNKKWEDATENLTTTTRGHGCKKCVNI